MGQQKRLSNVVCKIKSKKSISMPPKSKYLGYQVPNFKQMVDEQINDRSQLVARRLSALGGHRHLKQVIKQGHRREDFASNLDLKR